MEDRQICTCRVYSDQVLMEWTGWIVKRVYGEEREVGDQRLPMTCMSHRGEVDLVSKGRAR